MKKSLFFLISFFAVTTLFALEIFTGKEKVFILEDEQNPVSRINEKFEDFSVEYKEGKYLLKFKPKKGTNSLGVLFQRADMIPGPFSSIDIKFINLGEKLDGICFLSDFHKNSWMPTPQIFSLKGETRKPQTVSIDYHQFSLRYEWGGPSDCLLQFPIRYGKIYFKDLQEGKPYHVEIIQLDAVWKKPDLKNVDFKAVASEIPADSLVDLPAFSAELPQKYQVRRAVLMLVLENGIEVPLSNLEYTFQKGKINFPAFQFRIPRYSFAENCSLSLFLDTLNSSGRSEIARHPLQTIKIIARKPRTETISKVKDHNGVPTLLINGVPHSGMAYTSYSPSPIMVKEIQKSGVDLYSVVGTPTDSTRGFTSPTWIAPDKFDYSELDERIQIILRACPDAWIFVRLNLGASDWWCKKYPDEVMYSCMPDGKIKVYLDPNFPRSKPVASWASEQWRKDTMFALKKLIEHVEKSPYADRIIGYHLGAGSADEWMWSNNDRQGWIDYSKPNIRAFRAWLRRKYDTDEKLQQAWNQKDVTLDTAMIPLYTARKNGLFGVWRDPAKEQNVIDYYRYYAWSVADTIAYFSKGLKEITGRKKMVGVFYGYLLELGGMMRMQNSGHLALEKVLNDPNVDFLASPATYTNRFYGGKGTPRIMSLLESVKLHGKMWFDENDIRTSISYKADKFWGPYDLGHAGDILQQEKELAYCITKGIGQYWFAVGLNRYDSPEMVALLRRLTNIAKHAVTIDRSNVDDFAAVFDPNGPFYMKQNAPQNQEQMTRRLPSMSRSGASFSHLMPTDETALKQMKVVVFMTSPAPTEKEKSIIEGLKNNNRVLIFFNGSGFFDHEKFDLESASKLCGIRLKQGKIPFSGVCTFTGESHLGVGLKNVSYGTPKQTLSPSIYPYDPDMIVLARDEWDRPVAAMKKYPDWTAVYIAKVEVPMKFWQNVADYAKLHRYIDTPDLVWANNSMVSVCVDKPGQRTIRLRKPGRVREMLSGKTVSEKPVSSFQWDFPESSTAMFEVY